jgi:hypothetical protein
MGLVSPQFHVQYDSSLTTVKDNNFSSQWQYRAGFVAQREKTDDAASTSTNTGFAKRAAPVGEAKEQPIQGRHKRVRFGDSFAPKDNHGEGSGREKLDNSVAPHRVQDQNPETSSDQGIDTSPLQQCVSTNPSSHRPNTAGGSPNQEPNKALRSGRVYKPVQRLLEAMEVEITQNGSAIPGEIFCLQSLFPDSNSSSEEEQHPLTAYKATADPDTMYLHEAMCAPDRQKFTQTMENEVGDQMANGEYTIVRRKDVPEGHTIFRAVLQMKRKRDTITQTSRSGKRG